MNGKWGVCVCVRTDGESAFDVAFGFYYSFIDMSEIIFSNDCVCVLLIVRNINTEGSVVMKSIRTENCLT